MDTGLTNAIYRGYLRSLWGGIYQYTWTVIALFLSKHLNSNQTEQAIAAPLRMYKRR